MENKNIDEIYDKNFTSYLKKVGPLTILVAALLSLMPVAYLAIYYKVLPSINQIISAGVGVIAVYGVIYVVEPISYFPILGLSGTYMSFLSGNIGNMRVPCATLAQQVVGVEPNSKKGELIATMGIAGSIITNIIILTFIAVFGSFILTALPKLVTDGFAYILASLFGALVIMYTAKAKRNIFIAFPIGIVLNRMIFYKIIPPSLAWISLVGCVFVTVGVNIFLYKKGIIKS